MRLLRIAPSKHQELDAVHVDQLAPVGLIDDRQKIVPDLMPDLQEVAADRRRMLSGQDLGIGVIV
jgi:hypothetical protein